MKEFVLFLKGSYRRNDLAFYRKLCRGHFKIAVDGGYSFFKLSGIVPDLLIGDFDSIGSFPRNLPDSTEVLRYPADKDKTDAHLALDYCIARGAARIDIVMPSVGEPDHFLGGAMLLRSSGRKGKGKEEVRLRVVNPSFEIFCLKDDSVRINGCRGEIVSVIPLSTSIRLSTQGLEFTADNLKISAGDSRPLRNRIVARRATVALNGEALVVHSFR